MTETLSDHVEVADHGTIVMLHPISEAAVQWFEEQVGPPGPGGVYTCEPRMAGPICEGLAQAVLSWN
ncbi:hypothetical protein [Histidinibacterium lentulum]|uniref:Uncharacterized protein n=1 Tax=Histidinibacterium lentulum TaxID=2480588 RepID=A0A3N2QV21_9RHOB|nr:hypothetical protein [Histidinibacterium lentulum]ROT99074.1 hypothetical protein EAT49_15775 [Histidinibacterium lentulum]